MKINIPLSVKVFAYQYLATYLGISAACWRTLIFTLVNAISLGVCFFLSLYFVDSLGFDIKSVGLLMSCYGTGTVIGGIMSGKLCDQTSPEKIALLSLLAQGILFYSLVCFTTPLTLMLVLLLLGISTYCFKTANYIVMLSQCQGDAKMQLKVVNVSHAASNFGLGISGVMIGALANFGFHLIFYLAAGVIFLLTLYAATSTFRHSLLTMKQGENASLQTSSVSHDRNTKVLIHTLISVFAVGLIIAQLGSTYPVYIKEAFPELYCPM